MVSRSIASVLLWACYLGVIGGVSGNLGGWTIPLAFVLSIPLIVMSGAMWGMFGNESSTSTQKTVVVESSSEEKRKRERLDKILRDLSDEDLERLRERLNSGTVTDDHLQRLMLGDDGELVYEKRRS